LRAADWPRSFFSRTCALKYALDSAPVPGSTNRGVRFADRALNSSSIAATILVFVSLGTLNSLYIFLFGRLLRDSQSVTDLVRTTDLVENTKN
jgi:hypothetical protein